MYINGIGTLHDPLRSLSVRIEFFFFFSEAINTRRTPSLVRRTYAHGTIVYIIIIIILTLRTLGSCCDIEYNVVVIRIVITVKTPVRVRNRRRIGKPFSARRRSSGAALKAGRSSRPNFVAADEWTIPNFLVPPASDPPNGKYVVSVIYAQTLTRVIGPRCPSRYFRTIE